MVRLYVKPYIIAKSSPSGKSPKSTIQGEDIEIEDSEYYIRPEKIKQEIISKFADWLTTDKQGRHYPNRASILRTINVQFEGLPEIPEKLTKSEIAWREAGRRIESEQKWREAYWSLSEELGRTPSLEEIEARL